MTAMKANPDVYEGLLLPSRARAKANFISDSASWVHLPRCGINHQPIVGMGSGGICACRYACGYWGGAATEVVNGRLGGPQADKAGSADWCNMALNNEKSETPKLAKARDGLQTITDSI